MRTTHYDADDILVLRLSEGPIVREVSQDSHTHVSCAADGTTVEVVPSTVHAATPSRRKICWNVRVTDEVPAPDEPVIEMIGWRSDMPQAVVVSEPQVAACQPRTSARRTSPRSGTTRIAPRKSSCLV
jgi:hypothetical protein